MALKPILSKEELKQLELLLRYSNKYEISIQFWPTQTAVYICKDGVELESYGGSIKFAIGSARSYLNRINKTTSPINQSNLKL